MAYRAERISAVVRQVISDAIARRLSDPRISSLTSVTRVELTHDRQNVDVYFSVIGDEANERTTLRGLVSARGFLQTLIAKQLEVRQCPMLRLHLDRGFKQALETIRRIDASRQEAGAVADRDGSFDSGPGERTSEDSPTP